MLGLSLFAAAPVGASQPVPVATLQPEALTRTDTAVRADSVRLIVSLQARTLWAIAGGDTIRTMSIAVASGNVLRHGAQRWRFVLPLGGHTVRAKRVDPIWTPPDWHYVEEARANHLRLQVLPQAGIRLRDGRRLLVRDSMVGLLTQGDDYFNALPIDEHIVFDGKLFIPPVASLNRRLAGALGKFALDLGDGYLLHGTRDLQSIGSASTHGCIRLADDDLLWVFEHTPVGARVVVRK